MMRAQLLSKRIRKPKSSQKWRRLREEEGRQQQQFFGKNENGKGNATSNWSDMQTTDF